MEVRIEPIDAATARPVREAVLRPGRPPAECVHDGDDDPLALHLGAFDGGRLIAVASTYPQDQDGSRDPRSWRVRSMATLPTHRGHGIGRRLLDGLIGHAAASGGTTVWCNGRELALTFYLRAGFEVVGERFILEGIGPHFRLVRPLGPDDARPLSGR